MKVLININ